MNEIIKVNTDTMAVSARELHKALEVKYDFKRWVESNFKSFISGVDFNSHTDVKVQTEGNRDVEREYVDYSLSIDMAKHLCLMSHTEKGKTCRQYLIDLEKAWNTPEQVMARALKIAEQTISSLKDRNSQLQIENAEMKPKATFADAVSVSDNAILIRDLAKLIKQNGVDMGEKRLYKWMRENGYICKTDCLPTQRAMETGLFEIEVRTVDRGGNYLPLETKTARVTGKGQIYFINKFLNE